MIEDILIQATLLLSVFIFTGLSFTHLYAGHKIKGIMFAAAGIFASTIGYVITFLLPTAPIYFFLANVFLVVGALLFYLSTNKLIGVQANIKETVIVFIIYTFLLAFFIFIIEMLDIRQALVSVTVIYIFSRIIYLLLRRMRTGKSNYLLSYLVLSLVLVIIQVVRLILIALNLNNTIIGNNNMSANLYLLIFTGLTFLGIAFILVITTSIYTRRDLLIERNLLNEWSVTDYLTKLPNRRYLFSHLNALMAKDEPFAVVMIDIDGFKIINDTYGHAVGDAVLIDYAKKLYTKIGHDHFVARLGGDEFVIVFTNIIEKETITNHVFTSSHLTNLFVNDKTYDFTIKNSAGVALFPDHSRDPSELISKADHALYSAKTSDANRIKFYHD